MPFTRLISLFTRLKAFGGRRFGLRGGFRRPETADPAFAFLDKT